MNADPSATQIAFQGEPGAYSEEAALKYFGSGVQTRPYESFDRVFESVEGGDCSHGLIPIENSLAGSIHQNYDLLQRFSLSIVGEYYLRVRHCLITLPGVTLPELKKVISHPQGLAQCQKRLRELRIPQTEAVYDTAGSVKIMRAQGDRAVAAIASRRAAEIYGMNILIEGLEDDPQNYTRFLAIAPQGAAPDRDAKTSIVFSLDNKPGALFKALSVFALRDIDLTKIESRPMIGTPWEYFFYIDFAGSTSQAHVQKALDHLGEYATMLRVLGSYPRFRLQ